MKRATRSAFGAAWLMVEAQQVIALRLAKLARGGPKAGIEAHRMVSEKVAAGVRVAQLMATGRGHAAIPMLRQRVRANRKRLSKPSS